MKTLLTATALVLLPTLSFAMCAGAEHTTTAMSCAPGTVYDAASETCVPQGTS